MFLLLFHLPKEKQNCGGKENKGIPKHPPKMGECGGKIAYAVVTRREMEKLGVEYEHFDTAIDIVRTICGVKIAFIVKETDKGEFRASLRSMGADVSKIAASFGGGGHIRAAGCTVIADSIESAAKMILERAKRAI